MNPVEIIKLISDTSGTNAKLKILEQYKDNEDLQSLLYFAYSPYVCFGFTNIQPTIPDNIPQYNVQSFIMLIKVLAVSPINDKSVKITRNFLEGVNSTAQEIYCGILNKNLSIGIAAKSINKIIPNLIPTFECMLASPFKEFKLPALAQEKLDGVRCIMIKDKGKVAAFTRTGNIIPLKKLSDILKELPGDDIVLDGELLLSGKLRKDTSGKINSMLKTGYKKEIDEELEYFVFDAMTLNEWASKTSLFPAFERVYETMSTVATLGYPFLFPRTILAESEEAIALLYREIRKEGGEGIIVKSNSPYEWKRSNNWQKVKAICSCTLEITGFIPGTGKNTGKVGAVSCKSSDGLLTVDVNPKTDEIRDFITQDQQKLVYSKIEVLFNELITNREGNYSLFLPRMADNWLRCDKNTADDLPTIIQESHSEINSF